MSRIGITTNTVRGIIPGRSCKIRTVTTPKKGQRKKATKAMTALKCKSDKGVATGRSKPKKENTHAVLRHGKYVHSSYTKDIPKREIKKRPRQTKRKRRKIVQTYYRDSEGVKAITKRRRRPRRVNNSPTKTPETRTKKLRRYVGKVIDMGGGILGLGGTALGTMAAATPHVIKTAVPLLAAAGTVAASSALPLITNIGVPLLTASVPTMFKAGKYAAPLLLGAGQMAGKAFINSAAQNGFGPYIWHAAQQLQNVRQALPLSLLAMSRLFRRGNGRYRIQDRKQIQAKVLFVRRQRNVIRNRYKAIPRIEHSGMISRDLLGDINTFTSPETMSIPPESFQSDMADVSADDLLSFEPVSGEDERMSQESPQNPDPVIYPPEGRTNDSPVEVADVTHPLEGDIEMSHSPGGSEVGPLPPPSGDQEDQREEGEEEMFVQPLLADLDSSVEGVGGVGWKNRVSELFDQGQVEEVVAQEQEQEPVNVPDIGHSDSFSSYSHNPDSLEGQSSSLSQLAPHTFSSSSADLPSSDVFSPPTRVTELLDTFNTNLKSLVDAGTQIDSMNVRGTNMFSPIWPRSRYVTHTSYHTRSPFGSKPNGRTYYHTHPYC